MAPPAARPAAMPRARAWVFTYYAGHAGAAADPLASKEALLLALPDDSFDYLVWQQEVCPETGREHLQGYIKLPRQLRLNQVIDVVGFGNYRVARGSPLSNKVYCTKEESRKPGCEPHERGVIPQPQGARNDLQPAVELLRAPGGLKRVREEHPILMVKYRRGMEALYDDYRIDEIPRIRPVAVFVLHGTSGAGKSVTAEAYDQGNSFSLPAMSGNTVWFDGYSYQRTLLIQEFDGGIPYRLLLQILDGLPQQFEVKGGYKHAAWTTVVLTSNNHPCQWYPQEAYMHGPLERRITAVLTANGVFPNTDWLPHTLVPIAPPPPPVFLPAALAPPDPVSAPPSPPSSPDRGPGASLFPIAESDWEAYQEEASALFERNCAIPMPGPWEDLEAEIADHASESD